MAKKLEIKKTKVANDYTTTAIASTVYEVDYLFDGVAMEKKTSKGNALVLVIDGTQKDLVPNACYDVQEEYLIQEVTVLRVGGPKAAPWIGAPENEKATYYFRQALLVDHGEIVENASVKEVISGGEVSKTGASGIVLNAGGAHFNGILIDNGSTFEINDSKFYAYGDGGDDLAGWGTSIMADNKSVVSIQNSYIETEGAIRCGLYVDNTSIADVKGTVIYSKETPDTYQEYADLTPGMMKRVPFALGMEGTVRSLNVMADGQGKFKDCIVVSTGWGAISTDSGTSYDICKTYALDVEDTLSGIGTLEVAQDGKEYTATKTVGGVTYGFTVGGSGYVTYADSGVHNRYKNVEFYAPDYIQVMGSGRTGSSYIDSYLKSEHTAFMTQQTGGGTFSFENTTIDTVDALLQIKSGKANTGFSNIILDGSTVRFSGTSTRSKDGILVELVESDDAGNPGITTYTINDCASEAVATMSEISDCNASLKNGDYQGDIYNCIYNYKQALNVIMENATYRGTISSTTAIHVDLEGNIVPNGTVLNAFMGSKEYNHCNYAAEQGGMGNDARMIGRFCHTVSPVLNNPICVVLSNSTWEITGNGYVESIVIDHQEQLTSKEPVMVYTRALTIGKEKLSDGTYVFGNVSVVVDSTEIKVEDNGVVDAGQTYGNVVYTFIAKEEDGTFNSKAISLKRQNYIDGNIYFKVLPMEGKSVLSYQSQGGSVSENHEGGELEIYDFVLSPEKNATEMVVEFTISNS